MTPNVPHFPVFYYGVLRAGGVVVPMNRCSRPVRWLITWATPAPGW